MDAAGGAADCYRGVVQRAALLELSVVDAGSGQSPARVDDELGAFELSGNALRPPQQVGRAAHGAGSQ
jgi:hypothetical protein